MRPAIIKQTSRLIKDYLVVRDIKREELTELIDLLIGVRTTLEKNKQKKVQLDQIIDNLINLEENKEKSERNVKRKALKQLETLQILMVDIEKPKKVDDFEEWAKTTMCLLQEERKRNEEMLAKIQ